LVRRAFAAWARGTGSVYDLMDDDAEIVIPGTTAHSGTYRKDVFLAEVAGPFVARFAAPPLRRLVALWSDGSAVVVRAEARGVTLSGASYVNAYMFIFECVGRRIARLTEFLDMAAFEAVWDRVEPPRHGG
jgi:ketosteroid isomerase-like protein